MRFTRLLTALLGLSFAACTVYPADRDTTQPDKILKSHLVCSSPDKPWAECSKEAPAKWYFRATVIRAPYEAWWTFEGEQSNSAEKIVWEVTEDTLYAYRAYETFKGGDGTRVNDPNYHGEPIAAWRIQSHFDVWHQYNPATGEQLPVLYEAMERPWYEREYIRVDWSKNLISGYGFFMGSKLTVELFGEVKAEPAVYAVNNPSDPDYRILTKDYVDIVSRETHTPMSSGSYRPGYFNTSPISQVDYRYSFMRAAPRDYQPVYYPDPAFEKFGYFRVDREVYDADRGTTDFLDYKMERWNVWAKTHSAVACSTHKDCGGDASKGVTCDLSTRDAAGKGLCTLPYTERGLKPVTYYLSGNFAPGGSAEKFTQASCMVAQGWNVALKTAIASAMGSDLKSPYNAPKLDDQFAAACDIGKFNPVDGSTSFDLNTQDLFVLKYNTKDCNQDGVKGTGAGFDRWCARPGDIRYNMIYWVDQASMGSPLGYGPVSADPETGEIIQGNAFIYGAALLSYKSYVGDVYDLITGAVTEDAMRSGENIREYYQNLSGNQFPPTVPQNGFLVNDQASFEAMKQQFEPLKERMEQLKKLSPAARSPFAQGLKGSYVERMLVDNDEWKVSNGMDLGHSLTEEELDAVSPFRASFMENARSFQKVEDLLSRSEHCVYRANEYTDATVSWLAQRYAEKGLGRDEAVQRMLEDVYRGTTEHEVGHNMGLRHNFEASFDRDNYFEGYYTTFTKAEFADPKPVDFSQASPPKLPLTPDEYLAYDAARREARAKRERAGIKLEQYSSIMDYGGQFYSDFRGLGKYDIAALKFGYGNRVEVFEGAPNVSRSNRLDRAFYLGGDSCTADSDCPYNGVGQTCQPNAVNPAKKFCSSSDKDLAADSASHPVAKYRFCSDERTYDRPFCNRFDEGASSTEIVENLIDSYDRNYIFNNFRRYRRYFGPSYTGRIWDRYFSMMGKQYASLLYQLYYNQSAVLSSGAGSFSDMLGASVKAMNFFTQVLTTPDVGAYSKTPFETSNGQTRYIYERYNRDCKAAGTDDLAACLGVGKYFYSVWETGYYGQIERQARAGTFNDKILATLALTNRDWGNPQANDETYPLSFYDGFQGEMLKLFSGLISADIKTYAPAVKRYPPNHPSHPNEAYVAYRDVWSGSFFNTDATSFDYNAEPVVKYPGSADLDHRYDNADLLDPDGSSPFLRFYALVLSLQSWPSVYDQTYADYLQLYTFGGPEVRFPADGVETVQYESPRRKKIYMAVQTPDKKSIIFPLVKQAADIKADYDHYNGLTPGQVTSEYDNMKARFPRECNVTRAPTALDCRRFVVESLGNELDNRESFLNITADVRRLIGLSL